MMLEDGIDKFKKCTNQRLVDPSNNDDDDDDISIADELEFDDFTDMDSDFCMSDINTEDEDL